MGRNVVVGAGIIGLAVAARLAGRGEDVVVLEKEPHLAAHQTGRNSGVVHAGLYYTPGSAKARLCRRGVGLLREYCTARGLPYDECGKLVVALDEEEAERLDALAARATENGVPGIRVVGPAGIRAIEPFATGVAAVHSPTTAITDFVAVSAALADDVAAAGGRVRLGVEVTGLRRRDDGISVDTDAGPVDGDRLVVCAGLHVDRLAADWLGRPSPRIVPFRGDYYRLVGPARRLVRGLVYPVPDPRYPFLGVHLTKRVDGDVLVGPNARLALGREAYDRAGASPAELARILRDPSFLRLARAHWRTGVREVLNGSRAAFARGARRYVPALAAGDLELAAPGIRAQAVDPDGSLVDDFRIDREGSIVIVRNAPSPAATSSLAIAEEIVGGLA